MAKVIFDGGPAFPKAAGTWEKLHEAEGMSLRDWFAGAALTGMLPGEAWADTDPRFVAQCAYNLADAMLAHRKGKED